METGREEIPFSLLPVRSEDVGEISTTLCSMDPWLTMGYRPGAFESYLLQADPTLGRYVVMTSEKVAGVLSLRSPWLFGPLIDLLALFDGFQGKGIGGRIIRLVESVCHRYKWPNIWLTVSSFNLKAQKFYSRAGFERTAILDDLIKPDFNETLLRKRVA